MAEPGVIKQLAIALGLDVGDTPEKLEEIDEKADEAATSLGDKLGGAAKVAGVGLAGLAAGASAAAVGIFKLVEGSAASAAAVDDLAKRTGRSARDLQRVGFAFEQAGGSTEMLLEAFKTLDVQLGMVAKTGTGPAADALEKLGLRLDELQGKGAEEQLSILADAIARVEDPATRTSAAVALFGGAGQRLVPLLADGSAALRDMGDEAERLGLVLTDEAIAAGAELDDTLAKVQAQIAGVARDVGLALAPSVSELAAEFSTWISENRDLLEQGLDEFLSELVPQIVDVAKATLDVVGAMSDLVESAGGAESALTTIAAGYVAIKVAALGIPGAMTVAGAAIGYFAAEAISELSGVNAELRRLDSTLAAGRTAIKQGERGQKALDDLDALSIKDLGRLSEEDLARRMDAVEIGINAAASAAGRAEEGTAQVMRFREAIASRRATGLKLVGIEQSYDALERGKRLSEQSRKLDAAATKLKGGGKKSGGGGKKPKPKEEKKSEVEQFDPILSEILGVDVSAVTSRAAIAETRLQPQTLINTVHNSFAFDVDIAVNGARAPDEVATSVSLAIRKFWDDKMLETAREVETRIVK